MQFNMRLVMTSSQDSWKWCWLVVWAQVNGRKKIDRCEMGKFPHTWVKIPRFWAEEQKHRLVTAGSTAAFYWQSQSPKALPACTSFWISSFAAMHNQRWITIKEWSFFFTKTCWTQKNPALAINSQHNLKNRMFKCDQYSIKSMF